MKPLINQWANFLSNEKLTPEAVGPENTLILMKLCEKLVESGTPYGKNLSHKHKLEIRRLVCNTAMDMGIDLMSMKKRKNKFGGTKPAMGSGLLDMWTETLQKKFGSSVGTNAEAELRRRKIVTKLTKQPKE